jgi:hypothetical protein
MSEEIPETDKRCRIHPEADYLFIKLEGHHHYGKFVCAECGKFITWAKTPKTSVVMKRRQQDIINYIKSGRCEELNTIEINRLLKLYSKPHIGVEQEWFDQIMMENI